MEVTTTSMPACCPPCRARPGEVPVGGRSTLWEEEAAWLCHSVKVGEVCWFGG